MATRDYRIRRPLPAAVRARGCPDCTRGWETFCNEAAPIGAAAARYIRSAGGFRFAEMSGTVGGALAAGVVVDGEIDATMAAATPVTVFRFAPGQPCFRHPGQARFFAGHREHVKLADWLEDLDQHVGRLACEIQKG